MAAIPIKSRLAPKALDTPTRILEAAERLFLQHGFAATSMRMITADAEVNLAAVNYHFGSKDALIEAVFTRRLGPLNRQVDHVIAQLRHEARLPVAVDPVDTEIVDQRLALHVRHRRDQIGNWAAELPRGRQDALAFVQRAVVPQQ